MRAAAVRERAAETVRDAIWTTAHLLSCGLALMTCRMSASRRLHAFIYNGEVAGHHALYI